MNEEWNGIMAFIISSAMGCVKEPPIYGPLRLIETMEKLIGFAEAHDLKQDPRLLEIKRRIDEGKTLCMYDEEAFVAMLQEIGLEITELLLDVPAPDKKTGGLTYENSI